MKKAVCVLVCLTLVGLALAANEKAAKSAKSETPKPTKSVEDPKPPPPPPKAEESDEMDVVDYLRSGALVVAFVVACFAGREKWLQGNTVMLACMGAAMYFFPKGLIEYQMDGKVDGLHLYMGQQCGSWMIMMAVVTHFAHASRNPTVSTALLLARSLGGLMMVLCSLMDYMKQAGDENKLNRNFLTFGFLFLCLWTAGNILYTFRSTAYVGGAVSLRNRVSIHVFIDSILLVVMGMFYYAYPEHGYSQVVGFKIDGVHAHQMRAFGAMFYTYSLFGILSLFFTDDKDKRIFLLGRITVFIFSMPVILLYQWKYQFLAPKSLIGTYVFIALVAINIFVGYFHPISLPKFLKRD